MTKHHLFTAVVLCAIGMGSHTVVAQTPVTGFKVLASNGTPDEQSILRVVTDRLAKKAADPTFTKSLDDAVARADYKTTGRILVDAIGVKVSEIVMSAPTKVGSSHAAETPFRLTSNAGRLNPWYLIFHVGGQIYCASTSTATCEDALHKMGYKDTVRVW